MLPASPSLQSLLSPPATNIQPLPEYKTAVAERSKWVLSHYGVAKTCWDITGLSDGQMFRI